MLQTLSGLNQYTKDHALKFGSVAVIFILSFCTGPTSTQSFIVQVGAVVSISNGFILCVIPSITIEQLYVPSDNALYVTG
jgi:hypothetical protein